MICNIYTVVVVVMDDTGHTQEIEAYKGPDQKVFDFWNSASEIGKPFMAIRGGRPTNLGQIITISCDVEPPADQNFWFASADAGSIAGC